MGDNFIKRLMTSMKCATCGQHYSIDSVNVLGHEEELWFLRAVCSACNTQCLVAAVIKESNVSEDAVDLTEVELDRFKNVDKITADDLLDIHDFLKEFDGNFSQLFSQKEA